MKEIKELTLNNYHEIVWQEGSLLLDIREKTEFDDFNIGGMNIPPHEINEHLEDLQAYKNIIVACSNGTRSGIVARLLQKKLPQSTIYDLSEGVF